MPSIAYSPFTQSSATSTTSADDEVASATSDDALQFSSSCCSNGGESKGMSLPGDAVRDLASSGFAYISGPSRLVSRAPSILAGIIPKGGDGHARSSWSASSSSSLKRASSIPSVYASSHASSLRLLGCPMDRSGEPTGAEGGVLVSSQSTAASLTCRTPPVASARDRLRCAATCTGADCACFCAAAACCCCCCMLRCTCKRIRSLADKVDGSGVAAAAAGASFIGWATCVVMPPPQGGAPASAAAPGTRLAGLSECLESSSSHAPCSKPAGDASIRGTPRPDSPLPRVRLGEATTGRI
mmetsp:Transcript_5892/g.14949  ORF Transcript_5892/g.14949 Transcript_5892/m.14949 type:complete len:299 (+) Transcript_5892:1015-1911(+)